jgi:hypothetical protein
MHALHPRLASLLCLLVIAMAAPASATLHTGTIDGDEAQATTCSAGSTSRIVGTWSYDDVTGLFSWSYTYGDNAPVYDDGDLFAGGTPTLAHFHGPAAPGVPAGVQVGTTTANPNVASATISGAQGVDLLAELWYLNVHSSTCGGGELRGQLLLTPTPAVPSLSAPMLGLLVSALVASAITLAGTRRRLVA